MKIKVLLAKYLDWVILIGLAGFLAFALLRAFVLKGAGMEKVAEEITQYERVIKEAMISRKILDIPQRDYVAELRARYEHPAVISPYRRNPFVPPREIPYPGVLQIVKDKSIDVKLNGARLTDLIAENEYNEYVRAKFRYDPEDNLSIVTFTGIAQGLPVVKIRDDVEQVYIFRISVREIEIPPPPNPPVGVSIDVQAPREVGQKREPAMALIVFWPDNTGAPTPKVGLTTHADIYRKLAEAPDVEFKRINKEPIAPLTNASAQRIRQAWRIEAGPAPVERAPGPAPARGPVVPQEFGDIPPAPIADAQTAGPAIAAGAFAWVDATVEDGEAYVYKIVTLNIAADVEPREAEKEKQYVSASISIPTLVEFVVNSVSAGRARITLTRADPNTGLPLSTDFTVVPGMKIGGRQRIRVDIGPPARYNVIDFSTGAVLVDIVPAYRAIEYRTPLRADWKTGKPVYQVRLTGDARILYMTPGGLLRWKGKEQPKTTPLAPAAPAEIGPRPY